MSRYTLGIDPGLSGGLALYDIDDDRVICWRMPTATMLIRGHKSSRVDALELYKIAHAAGAGTTPVFMEHVGGMPRQSAQRSFMFGCGVGTVTAALRIAGLEVQTVAPVTWKRFYGLTGADKDASRRKAMELFPTSAHCFKLKRDDGVAEAALIAKYGAEHMGKSHVS